MNIEIDQDIFFNTKSHKVKSEKQMKKLFAQPRYTWPKDVKSYVKIDSDRGLPRVARRQFARLVMAIKLGMK